MPLRSSQVEHGRLVLAAWFVSRDYYPPPWFYEEHHNWIIVRDGYVVKLLAIDFDDTPMPGKRRAKFPALSKAEARSLALAIVQMAKGSSG